jgi:hypothetical protein
VATASLVTVLVADEDDDCPDDGPEAGVEPEDELVAALDDPEVVAAVAAFVVGGWA